MRQLIALQELAMLRHRLALEAEYYRLPRPADEPVAAADFVLAAMFLHNSPATNFSAVAEIYRVAFEQAQATARPFHFHRVLCENWN